MDRDTDQDWIRLGETDPYFGVSGDPRYHLAQVDDALLGELYRSGEDEVGALLRTIGNAVPDFDPATVLDVGCGVGRHTLAMANAFRSAIGYDVSPALTARAVAAAQERGVPNCVFVNELPTDQKFDWINSYQVFQHLPPERGYRLFSDLLGMLTLGGVCSLQVTLFRERRHVPLQAGALWRFDGRDANALVERPPEAIGQITLYDYDLNEILARMVDQQVALLHAAMTEHGGHHGIWLFGRKNPEGLILEPDRFYEAHSASSFQRFLQTGWSDIEDWGVWSSGSVATLRVRVPPALRDTHVLRLHGQAFVNPQHPRIAIEAVVNTTVAARCEIVEPFKECVLEIPLHAVQQDGTAIVELIIDSPMSPVACGLPDDDTRELGFALEAMSLERR